MTPAADAGGGAGPGPAHDLRAVLDDLVARHERPDFVSNDPIALPHSFDEQGDREVIGLFSALFAWGRRATSIAKTAELAQRMGHRPAAFVRGFDADRDGDRLAGFRHRTFNAGDAVSLVEALRESLRRHGTLEAAFAAHLPPGSPDIGPAIDGFVRELLEPPGTPARLAKHLSRPSTGSACKRLALFVRWMVRPGPVDLGLWTAITPSQLVVPLDVHSARQARRLGLLERPQNDWRAVLELTAACRELRPDDPARYDFALFGAGVGANRAPVV